MDIGPHFANLADCVVSCIWQDLNADFGEEHQSSAAVLLGNIAYRTRRKLTFNPHAEKFVNDDDANAYRTHQYRHPYVMPDKE